MDYFLNVIVQAIIHQKENRGKHRSGIEFGNTTQKAQPIKEKALPL